MTRPVSQFTESQVDSVNAKPVDEYARKKFSDIEYIAKYNLDHNTNFHTIDQIEEHRKQLEDERSAAEMDKLKQTHPYLARMASDYPVDSSGVASSSGYTNLLRSQGRWNAANEMQRDEALRGMSIALNAPLFGPDIAAAGLLGGGLRIIGGSIGSWAGSKYLGDIGKLGDELIQKHNPNYDHHYLENTGLIGGSLLGWGTGSNALYRGSMPFAARLAGKMRGNIPD